MFELAFTLTPPGWGGSRCIEQLKEFGKINPIQAESMVRQKGEQHNVEHPLPQAIQTASASHQAPIKHQ